MNLVYRFMRIRFTRIFAERINRIKRGLSVYISGVDMGESAGPDPPRAMEI